MFALACSPRDESDAIEGHFDTFCSGHSFSKGLKFPSGDVGGTSATTLRTSSGRGRKVRASHALEVGTLAHHAPRSSTNVHWDTLMSSGSASALANASFNVQRM